MVSELEKLYNDNYYRYGWSNDYKNKLSIICYHDVFFGKSTIKIVTIPIKNEILIRSNYILIRIQL